MSTGRPKIKFQAEAECRACEGHGILVVASEKPRTAIQCNRCSGTGREVIVLQYRRFRGRKERDDVDQVYAFTHHVVTPDTAGGASYQEWLAQPDILQQNGRETRAIHCPAEFLYGSTLKIPNWPECTSGTFRFCTRYPDKEACWEKWDRIQSGQTEESPTPDDLARPKTAI